MSLGSNALESRKRKRAERDQLHDAHRRAASSASHQACKQVSPGAHHLVIAPRLLLPRGCLSDGSISRSTKHPERQLYSGRISCLEETSSREAGSHAKALVATTESGLQTLAVQRLQAGLFAVWPLPGWNFHDKASSDPTKLIKLSAARETYKSTGKEADDAPWWDKAAITAPLPPVRSTGRDEALKSKAKTYVEPVKESSDKITVSIAAPNAPVDSTSSSAAIEPAVSGEELLATLRSKYLETLYVSRTPLAYFAKGPLSRARTATISPNAAGIERDLHSIYTDLLMTASMSEKKYTSALPDVINAIPIGATVLELQSQSLAQLHDIVKKSHRRRKLSKYGLLPAEEEYVCQWWLEKENGPENVALELPLKDRVRTSLSKQRIRETQIQVMLVLEALIVQSANPTRQISEKPVDLQRLLDILVDRLCIWQTTQDDMINSSPDKARSQPPGERLQPSKTNTLQDFCTEVLVPFYAVRLPEVFASLCRKMGTVNVASPARPALKRISSLQRPSSAAQVRPGSVVSRKGLKRTATDIENGQRTPSLARSSTDSLLSRVKREPSELLLQEIPLHKPSTLQDRRYRHREVDIAAISRATRAKADRKAFLDQELASAIDVLKKPNGRAAVQELVDLADGRHADANRSTSKRKREPIRSNGVHVKATPKAIRWQKRDNSAVDDGEASGTHDEQHADLSPPGTRLLLSDSRVPSTSKRLPSEKLVAIDRSAGTEGFTGNPAFRVELTPVKRKADYSLGVQQSHHADGLIEATPTRGSVWKSLMLFAPQELQSAGCRDDTVNGASAQSPLQAESLTPSINLLIETPVKPRLSFAATDSSPRQGPQSTIKLHSRAHADDQDAKSVSVSISKEPNSMELVHADDIHSTSQATQQTLGTDTDVYQALGWDDEEDLI